MRITSRENRQIKEIAKLYKNGRSRKENGLFVVEGARICVDAADSGIAIATLVCSDAGAARYPQVTAQLSEMAELVLSVPDAVFAALADTAHPQGILAVCRMPALRLDPKRLRPGGRYLAATPMDQRRCGPEWAACCAFRCCKRRISLPNWRAFVPPACRFLLRCLTGPRRMCAAPELRRAVWF